MSADRSFGISLLFPNLTFVSVIAFLAAFGMAASLIIGFKGRAFALLDDFAMQLHSALPAAWAWPWTLVFMVVIWGYFRVGGAGQGLASMRSSALMRSASAKR